MGILQQLDGGPACTISSVGVSPYATEPFHQVQLEAGTRRVQWLLVVIASPGVNRRTSGMQPLGQFKVAALTGAVQRLPALA